MFWFYQEEDSEGNEWRSNTSSSSALDSLETDPRNSRRLDVLQRYSSESSDVSDLSRGAPESSPDERRSIPSVTVDTISGGGGVLFEELRRCSTGSALPRMPIPENQARNILPFLKTFFNPHLKSYRLQLPLALQPAEAASFLS